uniref:WW domain-containing protein n=1 Tax=Guillardia theta TaxID=55529 RepID=A0A7S4PHH0_GUITH
MDMQDRAEKFVPALERRIMVDPGQLGGRDITDLAYAIEKLELKVSLSMQQEISRAAAKFVSSYSSGELAVTLSGLTFGGHALCEELVEAIPLSSRALGRNLSASTAISILQALSSGLESSGGEIGGEHRKSLATSILLDVARMLDRCDTQQVAKIVLVCSRLQLKVQQEVETSFARKFLQLLERYSTAIRGGSRAQQGGRPSSDFQQANFQREFQHLFLFARTSYSLGWDSPLHAQYLDMLREVTLFFARSSDPAVVLDMYVSLSSGEELESCLRARFPELLLEGEQEELPTAVTGDALGGQRGGLQMKNFLSSLLKLIMDLRDRMQAADLGRFYLLLLLSGDAKEEARSSTWVGIFSKLAGKLEEVPAKTCCMIICSLALLGVIPSVEALGQAVKRVVRGREELSIADRSCMLLALGMFNQTQLVPDFKELYDEMLDTLLDEQTSSESEKAKSKDSEDVDMFDVEDVKEKERRIRMRESLSNPYLHAQMAIMLLFSQVILCNNDNSMEDVWKKNGSETNSESREVALLTTMLMRLRQALLSDAGKVGEDAVEKKLGKSSLERFYMLTSLVGLISPQATATLGEREKETMETIRMAGKKCLMLLQDFTDGEEGSRCLKEISETAAEFGVELRVGRRDEGAGFLLPLSNEEKKVVLDVVRAEDELFSPEETSLRLNGRFELRRQILSLSGWSLLQVRLSSWKLVREVNVEKKKFLFRGDRLRNYISSEFEEECILRALPRLHHRVEVMRLLEALLCIHDGFVRMDAGTIALCLRKLGQQNPMDNSRRLQEIVFQSGLLAHCSSKLDEMDGSQQAQLFNDVVSIWIEVGRPRSRFPTSLMVTLMKLGEEAMKGDNLDLSMVANMCSGILEAKDELPKEVLSQTLLALVNRCKDEEFVRLLQVDVVVPVFACTCLMRSLSVGQHLVDMIAVEKLKEKIDGCGAELRTRHVQTIFWWMGCAGDRSVNFSYRLIKRLQQQVGEMSAQELKDVVCFHAQLQLFLSTEMGLQMMDRFKQLDVLEALPLNDCVFILSSFALSCVEDETFVLALLRRIDLLERSPAMSSSNEWNVEMEIRFLWCCVAMPCLCNTLFRPDRTDSSEQPLSSFSSLHTRCRFRILERWTKNQFSVQGTREEKRLSQLELSMLCQYHVAVRLLIAQGCSNAQLERLGLVDIDAETSLQLENAVRNQSVTLEKQRKTVSCKVYGEAADVFKDMGYEPCRDFESFCYDRDTMEGRGRSRERAAILGDKRISVGYPLPLMYQKLKRMILVESSSDLLCGGDSLSESKASRMWELQLEHWASTGQELVIIGCDLSLKYWKDTSKSDKTFLDVRDLVHAIVELFAETSDRHADRNGARLEASSSSPLLDFDHHIGLSPDPDWDEAFPSARDENSDEERKDEGGSSARKHVSRKKKASKLLWSVHYSKTKERWFYYNNDTKQREWKAPEVKGWVLRSGSGNHRPYKGLKTYYYNPVTKEVKYEPPIPRK